MYADNPVARPVCLRARATCFLRRGARAAPPRRRPRFWKRMAPTTNSTFYEALEVAPDADEAAIKKA